MENIILLSILVLGGIALIASVILYFVSQKFAVEEDTRVAEIENFLPQANCGACGKAGCHDFAVACVAADAKTFSNLFCPVGGVAVMKKIADRLGYQAAAQEPSIAVLRCNGTCLNAPAKIAYDGIDSCKIAAGISIGQSGCPNGCLRLGDCVKACKFGALSINPQTGIPVVDEEKCTSCGVCVKTCPRGLFEIRPKGRDGKRVYVACRNTQKGAQARKNCAVACIGCMKCTKINPEIKVADNLSYIPASVSADQYGEALVKACPTGAIVCTGKQTPEEKAHD